MSCSTESSKEAPKNFINAFWAALGLWSYVPGSNNDLTSWTLPLGSWTTTKSFTPLCFNFFTSSGILVPDLSIASSISIVYLPSVYELLGVHILYPFGKEPWKANLKPSAP